MRSIAAVVSLAVLLLLCGRGPVARSGDRATTEKTGPAVLQALEEALEGVIDNCEASVACVLVSRSEEYARWRAAPANDGTGKLGKFDGGAARATIDSTYRDKTSKEYKEQISAIRAIDLEAPDHVPESYGSGIVVDPAGLILTNAHVVRNATKVYVRLPGGKGSYADIHASDPRSDLAVLRLLDPPEGLKPLKMAQPGKYRKGQLVLLLANPYAAGFRDGSPTASWGMIANVRRRAPAPRSELEPNRQTLHQYGTLLQLDTRLELGCSGGAVLNLKGELIGMTTALAALTGVETPGGFAVPLDAGMRRVVEVLKLGKEVEYGFLGVGLVPGEDNRGAKISTVEGGTPAERAELHVHDRILSINGTPVHEVDDLFLLLGTCLAGSQARIEVQNALGQKRTVTARLAKYYVPGPVIAANRPPARFGLRVDYSSIYTQRVPRIGRQWRNQVVPEGVVIREVVPSSPADKALLQVDKVITRVNNVSVTTPARFYEVIAKAGRSVEVTLQDLDGRVERVTLSEE